MVKSEKLEYFFKTCIEPFLFQIVCSYSPKVIVGCAIMRRPVYSQIVK